MTPRAPRGSWRHGRAALLDPPGGDPSDAGLADRTAGRRGPAGAATGTVALVGAGPGDPELITVRGHRLLAAADVLVHDRLVDPRLLDVAPLRAERIFVGKRPGHAALAQEAIGALLVERARRGLAVVRLKGGDPFIFGRGGEEMLALARAGVPFEVVPAVSSALGVPARAGIPVTHRGLAASFAVVTGHRAAGASAPDWAALARLDTLVVLMGVARLEEIVAALLAAGRDPRTPAALVERGTLPGERVVEATLGDLPERARRFAVRSPATLVVGAVVGLRRVVRAALASAPVASPPAPELAAGTVAGGPDVLPRAAPTSHGELQHAH